MARREPVPPLRVRARLLATVVELLHRVLGEDFALEMEIDEETSFSDDLELESIEFVALAGSKAEPDKASATHPPAQPGAGEKVKALTRPAIAHDCKRASVLGSSQELDIL